MEYLIGVCLALAVSLSARWIGLDRDRAFYPTVMVVIASYYGLFAIMGGSMVFHGELIANPGVPVWWPGFCLAYDVTASACLAWLLCHGRLVVSK